MKNKEWKQTELKASPMTAAERQAKRRKSLLDKANELKRQKEITTKALAQIKQAQLHLSKNEIELAKWCINNAECYLMI